MFKKAIGKLLELINNNTKKEIESIKILTGRSVANFNTTRTINKLADIEFKVFSQWGDDGIIQYLLSKIDIPETSEVFVEFGVENYTESNTRFLLQNNNWKGLVIDGSSAHVNYIKNDPVYWKHNLTAVCQFITKSNINSIIKDAGIEGEIGILSVDIDGNDYYVWKAIDIVKPVIVITEYNSIFGCDKPYSTIYQDDFVRTNAHYSNLFYGTSLLSACDLAEEKGYGFVGCNSAGNNAYFVRNDKLNGLKTLSCAEGFVDAKFRESRDKTGNLSLLSGINKRNEIKGLKVFNTRTNQEETL
jgi:hypothetical protein